MAPERRLISKQDLTSGSRIECTANVVGIVPHQIHNVLAGSGAVRGRVNDDDSGISYIIGAGDDAHSRSTVFLWEHSTQTLTEELVAPGGLLRQLTHPEHNSDHNLLVSVATFTPTNQPNVHGHFGSEGRSRKTSWRHVFIASPSSGVVCLWMVGVDASWQAPWHRSGEGHIHDNTDDCDASVCLPLKEGELISALTSIPNSTIIREGGPWIMVATSFGRMWKVTKTACPLGLRAKLVRDIDRNKQMNDSGIMRGLYNAIFTPSKKTLDSSPMVKHDNFVTEHDSIVALVPVVSSFSDNQGARYGTSLEKNASPPSKVQKTVKTPPCSVNIVTVSSSMLLRTWNVSLLEDSETSQADYDAMEGCIALKQLFPRNSDGTFVNLSNILTPRSQNKTDNLNRYRHVELIAPPVITENGQFLLLVIRIWCNDSTNDIDSSTRVYVLCLVLEHESRNFSIHDAVWLNRYSGESLSRYGGSIDCCGLVVVNNSEDSDDIMAYVGFAPYDVGFKSGKVWKKDPCTVTISAVCFSQKFDAIPRVKDLDLFSSIMPSLVNGCMGYDSVTGGCVLLATSGILGGVYVHFPRSTSLDEGIKLDHTSIIHLSEDENVLTIKSHIQSAFCHFLNRLRDKAEKACPASITRSVLPPSIDSCSPSVLTVAAVAASKELLKSGRGNEGLSSGLRNTSPLAILKNKLDLHQNYVNFLLHAGVYRKISTSGRIILRGHGEIIVAARATVKECQDFFFNVEAAVLDYIQKNELTTHYQIITRILEGISDNVFDLPTKWVSLQQYSEKEKNTILAISSSICNGIGAALRYRLEEVLYDVPSSDEIVGYSMSLWTSSPEILTMLHAQLQNIKNCGEFFFNGNFNIDCLQHIIEDMSAALLGGYHAILSSCENQRIHAKYEEAKILSIPLMRQYANSDGDLSALKTSLMHEFFEGIVQICHDHRRSWMYQGVFSDKTTDETYDLRLMLRDTPDSPYAQLHLSKDYRTGLSFCRYVLKWYTDQELYEKVFELGKECPDALSEHLFVDNRLSHLAWIHHLRNCLYENATNDLLNNVSSSSIPRKVQGGVKLWEKDFGLSLAKLSNKLMISKSPNSTMFKQRSSDIEKALTLIAVQCMLQEDDLLELRSGRALSAEKLLDLIVNRIKSGDGVEAIERFVNCGLALAQAIPTDQKLDSISAAAAIWVAAIQVDMKVWNSLAQESNVTVAGLSDDVLLSRTRGTAFVCAAYNHYTKPVQTTNDMNLLSNPAVRSQVVQYMGLKNDLPNIILHSAELACK